MNRQGKIVIKKSPTADTRTCDFKSVTKAQLLESSVEHIADVISGMSFFSAMISVASKKHDFDKITEMDGFHRDFLTGFESKSWWENHQKLNRHHLLQSEGVPDDVNLIDVIEMVVDCVMAGMARSGSVYPLDISQEVLVKAFENTVDLLKSRVVVEDQDGED